MQRRPRPRDYVDPWPSGSAKRGRDPIAAQKADDLALMVGLLQARIERNNAVLQRVAFGAGMDRLTLNRILTGDTWPGFQMITALSRSLHYEDVWADYDKLVN